VQELEQVLIIILAPIETAATKLFLDTVTIIDRVLRANRDKSFLKILKIQATKSDPYC
jgi:hypothetical protein